MRTYLIIVLLSAFAAIAVGDSPKTIAARRAIQNWERARDLEIKRHEQAIREIDAKGISDLHQARTLAARQENADEILLIDAAIEKVKGGQNWTPIDTSGQWARLNERGDRVDFQFDPGGKITCLTGTSGAVSWESENGIVKLNSRATYKVIDTKIFVGSNPDGEKVMFAPLTFK